MFDMKKRNSLNLKSSREAEEFRRMAVRRKVKGATEVDGHASHSVGSSGMCGSFSCDHACDDLCASKSHLGVEDEAKGSSVKGSPFNQQTHLHCPLGTQAHSPTKGYLLPQRFTDDEQDQGPNSGCEMHGSSVCPVQSCPSCPSPTRGGRDSFVIGVSGAPISPATSPQGIPILKRSQIFGSQSPSKRGLQDCGTLKEGDHSPAKLSPRNNRPFAGKPPTHSPVQGRVGSYSPARNSKSWLGLPRISSGKMEEWLGARKSLSVPDLIFHLEESRILSDKIERSPLKQLQLPNCKSPAINIRAEDNPALNHAMSDSCLASSCKEPSPSKMNDVVVGKGHTVVNVKAIDDIMEEGRVIEGYGSEFSRRRSEAISEDGGIHKKFEFKEKEDVPPSDKRKERGGYEPKDDENTEQKLYRVANELLQTERAYVARLHLIDQVFYLRLAEEAVRGSFPPEVIRNIFSNISSIYSFHSQFLLPDLEKCISHWNENPGLGNFLLQHAPFLRMYADYVRNFDQAMELVRTWTQRSSAFRSIIQEIQSQEACARLTLQHHMLEPVQRVPRYEMLLRDYLQKLPKDNPDYEVAQKSLQTITLAATHSNSAIRKAENLRRLQEIYEMVGEEEVVNPANEFLREGRLLKLAARNTSSMERHLFLFNHFLLCCTPKFSLVGQRFTVRSRIGVDGMQVQKTTNEDHPHSFQVSGKEKTFEVQASSEQDRDEWIKVIQDAIDVFQKKTKTFKMAAKEQKLKEPMDGLGRRAPRWIRDNEVTVCMKCQEPFNALTRRRHHCRACGCVVCWKCSDNKVALEYDGNKLNKVCKACYFLLTGQRGERVEGEKRQSIELPPESNENIMCGFMLYGDKPKHQQPVWCVISRSDPLALSLYTSQQDMKPQTCIPLLSCSVNDSLQELQGQPCFSLVQSRTTHTFTCDSVDLKQSWLAFLKVAVTGTMPAGTQCGYDTSSISSSSSSRCSNENVNDGRNSSDEEFVIISDTGRHS